jgi:hypothetical protein
MINSSIVNRYIFYNSLFFIAIKKIEKHARSSPIVINKRNVDQDKKHENTLEKKKISSTNLGVALKKDNKLNQKPFFYSKNIVATSNSQNGPKSDI